MKRARAGLCALALGWASAAEAQAPKLEVVPAPVPAAPPAIVESGPAVTHVAEAPPLVEAPPAAGSSLYGGVEYLLWWMKSANLPALVTRGSLADPFPGAIGQPGTQVLLGNSGFGENPFHGSRLTVGTWLDEERTWAVEANAFLLAEQREQFSASAGAPGSGVLALPFRAAGGPFPPFEAAAFAGAAGLFNGTINASLVQRLWGTEANLRRVAFQGENGQVSLLGGFRYLSLQESLDVTTQSTFPAAGPVAFVTRGFDSHATRNDFYGGQIGAQADFDVGRLRVSAVGKIALGNNHQEVNRTGGSQFAPTGGPVVNFPTSPAGRVGPDNAGERTRDEFAVLPELGVTFGYRLGDNVTLGVGYTWLYLSEAARPGEQIDRTVNILGNRRTDLFGDSDFWAQGINLGIQFRF